MQLDKQQTDNLKNFLKETEKAGFLAWSKKLMKEFKKAEIYLVGGAVRDALLKKQTKDYDFVVRNVAPKKLQKFLESQGWVELLGKNFGVFKFVPKNLKHKINPIDIALPRTEHTLAGSGAYRDFKVMADYSLDIKQDLSRRDFTINAMALKLSGDGFELIDEFGGLQDLKHKIIRTVGEAKERFGEDYSRMLRAIRFACQLEAEIENKTKRAIKKYIKEINKKINDDYVVAREIIAKELLKALTENPVNAFDLFDELGIFKELIPEIEKMKKCQQPKNYHTEGDVFVHTRLALKQMMSPMFEKQFEKSITGQKVGWGNKIYDSEVVVAVLLHDIDKPTAFAWKTKNGKKKMTYYNHEEMGGETAEKICGRLKLSSPEKIGCDCSTVGWLVKKHMMLLEDKVKNMRQTKFEKYMLSDKYPGEKLLQVTYADAVATIPEGEKIPTKKSELKKWISLQGFWPAIKRIKKIQKLNPNQKKPPTKLLDGHQVMKILKIKAGIKVGKVLDDVREAQLKEKIKTKKEAIDFIKKRKQEYDKN